ncbi:MAG: biotin/lipoyl-containing protein, partial [Pontixanthobacter sp.]
MASEIKVPALGESVTEGTIGEWLKKVGDMVTVDEPIVSLETDKVAVEVPSSVAGVISELRAEVGDTVEVGAVIAVVEEGGTAAAAPAAKASAEAPAPVATSSDAASDNAQTLSP